VAELITKRNMSRILKASVITDGMRRGLKRVLGRHGRGADWHRPRAQVHHARRHVVSVRIASQMTEVARSQRTYIHGTHWGRLSNKSPDNKDIGLTKHFAVMAHVTGAVCGERQARCWTWGRPPLRVPQACPCG
jgi:DNA-directed RNA polymerase beta subunit